MNILKPDNEFRAGTRIGEFAKLLEESTAGYPLSQTTLDLSEVIYMDSFSFRLVFNYLPKLTAVVPPKNQQVIDMYNFWLDSKKGLAKGRL